MATTLRPAVSKDFDKLYPLLVQFHTAGRILKEDWQRLFEIHWDPKEDRHGYVLLDGGEPVGLLGMVFSRRMIKGKVEKFCDLAAWIVHEEYRSESLRLLFPILQEKSLTITTFTASNRVTAVLHRLGFHDIEHGMRFIFPMPVLKINCSLVTEKNKIEAELSGEDKKIFIAHKQLYCTHLLIKTPSGTCYVILNQAIKKMMRVAVVSFASDREILQKYLRQVVFSLCNHMKVVALVVGDHFGIKQIPFSLRTRRKHAILFRSDHLAAADIDMIFSEVQILNLLPT